MQFAIQIDRMAAPEAGALGAMDANAALRTGRDLEGDCVRAMDVPGRHRVRVK